MAPSRNACVVLQDFKQTSTFLFLKRHTHGIDMQ